jgi:hypothetical protein
VNWAGDTAPSAGVWWRTFVPKLLSWMLSILIFLRCVL